MTQSICASWSLESLRGDGGMKPMPLEGAATRAAVADTWNGWSMRLKAAFAVAVLLVIVGISLGVAAAAGLFNSKALKLYTLNLCADNATSPSNNMAGILAASGSSYHVKPDWEGALYTKKADTGDGCVTTYTTYSQNWPPVTSNSSAKPDITDTDLTDGAVDMWKDELSGYYHLRINQCIVYYYNGNTAQAYTNEVSSTWPIVRSDGAAMENEPDCADAGSASAHDDR